MKKVAIVGTVGLPACYGGFETLVENLTKYKTKNIQYNVFCSRKHYKNSIKSHNGANLIYLPFNANGVESVIYDIFSLIYCLFIRPDVILVLGVSGCIFLPVIKMFSKSMLVTNIDGLEWKRNKWNFLAKWFLKLSEYFAVKYSDQVITDNEAISQYVNSEYGVDNITIAYGGDHAIFDKKNNDSETEKDYCLSVCRIEPENNIHIILDSFSKTEMKIKLIGNWDSSDYGIQLKEKFNRFKNIQLIDPIYDIERLYSLRRNCKYYIHGHSAGGTNPSLVEMMHFEVPIFAYDCTFNRFSTENKAHYFKDGNDLASLLEVDYDVYSNNAKQMRMIAVKKYTWKNIVSEYESIY